MLSRLRCLTRLSVYAVFVIVVSACQTTQPQSIQQTVNLPEMVFPLVELNKNPDALDAMFQTIMRGQTSIIKIDKGYIFPLVFDLENKAVDIDLNNNAIELSFNQDMYLSISKETTRLSKDGRNWYAIKDLKALKKMLAFHQGTLTFSVIANSEDSVAIVMTIATDAD
jgi:hypothetical protein